MRVVQEEVQTEEQKTTETKDATELPAKRRRAAGKAATKTNPATSDDATVPDEDNIFLIPPIPFK